jgi:hypothetical protein
MAVRHRRSEALISVSADRTVVAERDGLPAVVATVEKAALLQRWPRGRGEAVSDIELQPIEAPEER